jgi:hypothetical protein
MLKRLRSLVQAATGAADEEIVLGVQEVPSSQAMEMGQIMPDVARLLTGAHPIGGMDVCDALRQDCFRHTAVNPIVFAAPLLCDAQWRF